MPIVQDKPTRLDFYPEVLLLCAHLRRKKEEIYL